MENKNNPEHKIEYLVPFIGWYAYERDNGRKFNQNAVNADRLFFAVYNIPLALGMMIMGLETLLK